MKKLSLVAALFALLLVVNSCEGLKVTTDYDKKVDFSKYKTFAIDTFRQSESISQLNQQRILNAVKATMKSKGFTESNTPDLLVHISAILKERTAVSSESNFYGYGGFYRPYMWGGGVTDYTTYDVYHYKNGSLVIDIADAKTKNLIWEGIGNKEIDGPIKDLDTAIPQAINKIMETFPIGKTPAK
jgi:hypothetical protein